MSESEVLVGQELLDTLDIESVEETPLELFEALQNEFDILDKENQEIIDTLISKYTRLVRSLDKKDPLKGEVIARMKELRKLSRELKKTEKTMEVSGDKIFEYPDMLLDNDVVPSEFRDPFVRAADELFSLRDTDGISEDLRDFIDHHIDIFNERLISVSKNADPASIISALRGAEFELSRMVSVLKQRLEDIDFDQENQELRISYYGYPSDGIKLSSEPKMLKQERGGKGIQIKSDVPLVRNGKPYVYEAKSYVRTKYGDHAQSVNQALKYQAAIDEGIISGATVEVRGRMNTEFLGWAMGVGINDVGHVPGVEIVYTVPLPSGKEYRFPLKRALHTDGQTGLRTKAVEGLHFHNEERYDDEDMEVVHGVQASLVDKSILTVLGETQIDQTSIDAESSHFLPDHVGSEQEFHVALEKLFGYDLSDQKALRRKLRRIFKESRRQKDRKKKDTAETYTHESIAQKFSDWLGYDVMQDPHKALLDIWNKLFDEPERITTSELYQRYEHLRIDALHDSLRGKEVVINTTNEKSAVSEFANAKFVEETIRSFLGYLAANPKIAEAKSHYIIENDRVPEAVERVMENLRKVADFERVRSDSDAEKAAHATRVAMGYSGHPEGVTLDIEHMVVDVLYSMNTNGTSRAEAEKYFDVENVDILFHGDDELFPIFRSVEEFENAKQNNPDIQAVFTRLGDRSKSVTKRLLKMIKEAEFVRSYEWPERFSRIEDFVHDIEGEDRRYQEISIIDPVEGKIMRQTDTTDAKIRETERTVTRENIRRARAWLAEPGHEKHARGYKRNINSLEKSIKTVEEDKVREMAEAKKRSAASSAELNKDFGLLKKQERELRKKMQKSDGAEKVRFTAELEEVLATQKALADQRSQIFAPIKELSEQYQVRLDALYRDIEELYRDHVIPRAEWKKFAQDIPDHSRIDQNVMKVIYAIREDGDVIVQEEVLRGDVTGRAAHSELAKGRNIYGAGELAFEKSDGRWVLTEINNGSGHYRPDAESTLHYVEALIAQKGIDVSSTELRDCLFRGREIQPGHQPRERSLF